MDKRALVKVVAKRVDPSQVLVGLDRLQNAGPVVLGVIAEAQVDVRLRGDIASRVNVADEPNTGLCHWQPQRWFLML